MSKRIYLAGSMKNASSSFQKWRKKAGTHLAWHGIETFDPANYYNYESNYHTNEKEIMQYELRQLRDCDMVLVNLTNVNNSVGTIQELMYAYCHGIPIFGFYEVESEYISTDTKDYVYPWIIEECERIECGHEWDKPLNNICDHIINYL